MPETAPFEEHTDRYETWFETHEDAYRSELEAIRRLVPEGGYGVEIGVGSGRFAAPLDVDVGLDPSRAMLERARERGVETVQGVAEALPFPDSSFDVALFVTSICFVDDVGETLAEAGRVLDDGGAVVLGYVDRNSPVGEIYRERAKSNPFYRDAVFVSTEELVAVLEMAGFSDFEFVQTIYRWLDDIDGLEPIEPGYGDGSFVGLKATK